MKNLIQYFNSEQKKKPTVRVVQGELFEGGADLIVLPCSAKGTVSSATELLIRHFGLQLPSELSNELKLGSITKMKGFPGLKPPAKFYCFAASVFNNYSNEASLDNIG